MRRRAFVSSLVLAGIPFFSKTLTSSQVLRVGVNLPWYTYGYDIGGREHTPWKVTPYGYANNAPRVTRDFMMLKAHGIDIVRVAIFCDLRSGVVWERGRFVSFNQAAEEDFTELLKIATETGMLLIPVLFDFSIADGVGVHGNTDHPEVILNSEDRYALMASLAQLLADNIQYVSCIYAVDIFNEPENASVLYTAHGVEELRKFLKLTAATVKKVWPKTPVTLGCANRATMLMNWRDIPVDVEQFHYYDRFESQGMKFDFPVRNFETKKPVIIGEAEATHIHAKLGLALTNGYDAIIFWSLHAEDKFTKLDLRQIKAWKRK
ncbi:MAG TPA: hypothetical protein VEA59_00915 [Patescibacteria group bacterium]|nr:hypothetical protein [Patescibacteria group bacterium]